MLNLKKIIFNILDASYLGSWEFNEILDNSQYWSYEQLKAFQLLKLKELAKRFNLHIDSWEDFYRLPLTTKEDIRDYTEELENAHPEELKNFTLHETSGSTGTPLKIYGPNKLQAIKYTTFQRAWAWVGRQEKDKVLRLTAGNPKFAWFDYWANIKPLNYREITDEHMDYIVKNHPYIIHGVAGAIREIATKAKKEGHIPDLIKSCAYLMSEDPAAHKKELKSYFQDVFEGYGLAELCTVASECQVHHLHVNMETAIVEVINGEIVVTDLWNDITPIIRYRTGDYGKLMKSKCVYSHDILYDVKGRGVDYYDGPEVDRPIGWWVVSPISHKYSDLIKKWKAVIYPKDKELWLYVVWKSPSPISNIEKLEWYKNFLKENGLNLILVSTDKISNKDMKLLEVKIRGT
jgi:phenylacetate-CoA ligase